METRGIGRRFLTASDIVSVERHFKGDSIHADPIRDGNRSHSQISAGPLRNRESRRDRCRRDHAVIGLLPEDRSRRAQLRTAGRTHRRRHLPVRVFVPR